MKSIVLFYILLALNVVNCVTECINCNDYELKNYQNNYKFVNKRQLKGDLSVTDTIYMRMSMEDFDATMSMDREYSGENPNLTQEWTEARESFSLVKDNGYDYSDVVNTGYGPIPTLRSEGDVNRPILFKNTRFYFVMAAIDLMNLEYTRLASETNAPKNYFFSAEQVIAELNHPSRLYDPNEILDFMETVGVCQQSEYNDPAQRPTCQRYVIDNFFHRPEYYTHDLYSILRVEEHAVLAQVGLHPMYYMFYDDSAKGFVNAGYIKPSLAGVVTGFDATNEGNEYWEMFIRRHGTDNNRVTLSMGIRNKYGELVNPFAGITSNMYTIYVNASSLNGKQKRITTFNQGSPITTYQQFKDTFLKKDGQNVDETDVEDLVISPGSNIQNGIDLSKMTNLKTVVILDSTLCLLMAEFDFAQPVILTYGYSLCSSRRRRLQGAGLPAVYNAPKKAIDLVFADNSFNSYNIKFIAKNNTHLRSIRIGTNALMNTDGVTIENVPQLALIELGDNVLGTTAAYGRVIFHDLPQFWRMELGKDVFKGYKSFQFTEINTDTETVPYFDFQLVWKSEATDTKYDVCYLPTVVPATMEAYVNTVCTQVTIPPSPSP